MSHEQFKKFINPKNNAAIKEKFKQEKKAAKKERAAAINQRFEEKRALRNAGYSRNAEMPATEPKTDLRQKYPQHQKSTGNHQPLKVTVNGQQSIVSGQQQKVNSQLKTSNVQRSTTNVPSSTAMPLNKFIAHCGVTSRRDAIPLIKEGKVIVNGAVVSEPGFKVSDIDIIKLNGNKLFVTKNLVYILLNKPKDYITTTDDPQGRKTVLQLIKQATQERIYPIGRLDRNTSGVLLFTNDGELTQMLTHPSYNVKKVYEAKLDKPLTKADFDKILNGLKLDDGEIHADALAYADNKDKSIIGIEIHSGRNRIVRRIFEHLGYEVKALDRVMYANLTKKNVERGKWRYLSEKEIRLLKFMNMASSRPLLKAKVKDQII